MKLAEIITTLRTIGVAPVKTLGQNFLHDRNLARFIVEQSGISRDDYIVEIGPGLGALTEFALSTGADVLAIEKDGRLADFLRERFQNRQLEVVHGDALDFDLRPLYTKRSVKLLGNLPYYIASPLLLKFAQYPSPISLWLLMLQKDMAKRLSAGPRTKDYGALTLQMQFYFRIQYLRSVPATVFVPQPDIDSALVRLTPRDPNELPACDYSLFEKLVRRGFSQRRKQLGKLIRDDLPDWKTAARDLGLNDQARAEELSLHQWIELVNRASTLPLDAQPQQTEQFAVVDRNDRPLGAATRSEVHGNNLLHRAVHILIFNGSGEVFLQFRSRWKDRHPLRWDSSAAGHVDAGETYDNAAQREIREELGIDISPERIAKLPASERTGFEFIWVYRATYDGRMKPNSAEIAAGGFFPVNVVDGWIVARPEEFAPAFLLCWQLLREKLSAVSSCDHGSSPRA
jgi:16S rRNA (adenine1518-N6/adenine1519-N6)-dimethyltransferase